MVRESQFVQQHTHLNNYRSQSGESESDVPLLLKQPIIKDKDVIEKVRLTLVIQKNKKMCALDLAEITE